MNARILLVDDHPANLAALEAALAPEGHELHSADNGPDAIAAALRLVPDLVLLDVMMPGMDGYEVCRALRTQPSVAAVPIVMLTALHDRESRLAGLKAGADDFLSKPFPLEELRARVRTITRLDRHRVISEQRARFEQLFHLAPSAIVVVQAQGQLVSANHRAARLLSLPETSPSPPARPCVFDLFPPEAAARLRSLVGALLAAPSSAGDSASPRPIELRLPDPEKTVPRVLRVSATRLEERAESLALLAFEDLSAEVHAREVVENLNRRLEARVRERTRRLETANQLCSSYAVFVAHDLRSPLTALKGSLSFLLEGGVFIPDELLPWIQRARSATRLIEEMIGDTLTLAAGPAADRPAPRPIDPGPVIERLGQKLLALHPSPRPELVVHPMPPVAACPLLLERIFFNLISNAFKYTATRPAPRVEIGSVGTPDGPALYVRDNGVGFAPGETEALFAEFSRLSTSEGHEGLGLGLSLIARLVQAHHGRIWAEGRLGEGATFYVLLPPAAAPASAPAAPPSPPLAVP